MYLLDKLVAELISEHEGGETFFDNLDQACKNGDIIQQMFDLDCTCFDIITSGKFGLYMKQQYPSMVKIVVNGGLRDGDIISLEPLKNEIEGNNYIFYDDSFYLGRTRDKIKAEIEKWGGKLLSTIVAYDGSKEKDRTVKSLYRYYDRGE